MKIGIPKEIKTQEGRVALIPEACAELTAAGHQVFVQAGAGQLSGYPDSRYQHANATLVESAQLLYKNAELIVKVKEPVDEELGLLRADHVLFSYLHLAANPHLAYALRDIGLQAIAFETVEEAGQLPLLAPMSQIAGKIAAHRACLYLNQTEGGKGLLLGGLAGSERGRTVVMGAGNAGLCAAEVLAALGTNVTVFDKKTEKLDTIRTLGANVTGLYPYHDSVYEAVVNADVVIGAVLLPGAKAPIVVTEAMIEKMTPGSVVVDISVDQGGCIETTHPTSYDDPVYHCHGVIHFAVTNMPGVVPRSASQALSAVLLPYVNLLASGSWQSSKSLTLGLNVSAGKYTHPALLAAFG